MFNRFYWIEFGSLSYSFRRMLNQLRKDLARFSQSIFNRAVDCTDVIRDYHNLSKSQKESAAYVQLQQVYSWLFIPLTLWPIDFHGLTKHLLERIRDGKPIGPECDLLLTLLPLPPDAEICESVSIHEAAVKFGNYESLIHAQVKFDSIENELHQNDSFQSDWDAIKTNFDLDKFRNRNGIIRRRMVQERSFRPKDWIFSGANREDYFKAVFDAFCFKWALYGMENDKPLLQKLSVNLTPHGTLIFIPKYWSFDYKRDLNWGKVTELHRSRGVHRQGTKLFSGKSERREEAKRLAAILKESKRLRLKGDAKMTWIKQKMGYHPGTDNSRIRRLLKEI